MESVKKERAKPLRWRREPSERGLARVCQGERGWELRRGNERLASARKLIVGWNQEHLGYYFYAMVGEKSINTCNNVYSSMESAKSAAEKWVRDAEAEAKSGVENEQS